MSNKAKMTAEYFPHYAAQKKTVPILKAKFGSDGYSCWYQLLEMLCSSRGHFLDLSAPGDIDFMAVQMGIPVEKIELILKELIFRRKIDQELWATSRIIWCQGLVDNLKASLYSKRNSVPEKPIPSRECQFRHGNAIDYPEKTGSKGSEVKEVKEVKEVNTLSGPEIVPDPVCSEILDKLQAKVKTHRPNHKLGNQVKDLKTIGLMLTSDHRSAPRVLELLDWYPIGQEYMPEIFSASALREKYDKLDAAKNRSNGNGKPKFGSTIPTLPRRCDDAL